MRRTDLHSGTTAFPEHGAGCSVQGAGVIESRRSGRGGPSVRSRSRRAGCPIPTSGSGSGSSRVIGREPAACQLAGKMRLAATVCGWAKPQPATDFRSLAEVLATKLPRQNTNECASSLFLCDERLPILLGFFGRECQIGANAYMSSPKILSHGPSFHKCN